MSGTSEGWIGRQVANGRYEVLAKLGEGGMGTIYRAYDRHLECDAVIKVPHPFMLADPQFAARFLREIRSLVRLSHPHVVKIIDVGQSNEIPFAVMQYLPGGNLNDRRPVGADGRPAPMEPDRLRDWLPEIAKALDFIHSQGYVHRDVKPENILFDEHGNVYVSDFGIAKALAARNEQRQSAALTGTGMVLGTPNYMAPELCDGRPFDGRVDQYALAITVYELLCGRVPFVATTPLAVLIQHTRDQPPPLHTLRPSIPPGLSQAVDRALAKDSARRWTTCKDFAQAALGASGTRSAPSPATSQPDVRLACPGCAAMVRVPARLAGHDVKCPKCYAALHVSPELNELRVGSQTAVADAVAPPAPNRVTPPLRPALADEWYLRTAGGQEHGPVLRQQLDAWQNEGRISADCQICRGQSGTWQTADNIYPQLRSASPPPLPPEVRPTGSPTSRVVTHASRNRGHLAPASWDKRFLNMFVDWFVVRLLLCAVGSGFDILYAILRGPVDNLFSAEDDPVLIIVQLVLWLTVTAAYFTFTEVLFQRTVGKFLTRTMVVARDGGRASFGQIVGRTFARFIPFDAFSFLTRKYPAGWHDSLSGTRVVCATPASMQQESPSRPAGSQSGCQSTTRHLCQRRS